MNWNIFFLLSVAVLVTAVGYAAAAVRKYKAGQLLTPFNAVFVGVFFAVFAAQIPVFQADLAGESFYVLKLLLFDALQTIQVFTVNVGGDFIIENVSNSNATIRNVYSGYMSCLFFAAPLLTFGFLVSLFKNALATLNYRLHFWVDVYIFSELNEKSVLLAQSIRRNHKKALIVFTDVDREEGKISCELIESAKELAALVFEKDVISIDFSAHSKKAQICFFVIGKNEGENLIETLKLYAGYNDREKTRIYVFSTETEGELLLSNLPKGKLKLRRVNEVRSLVYRYLHEDGHEIFESAAVQPDGTKAVNAVVIGLGKTGTEVLKALSWYCQMDGYSINIQAYDRDELAQDRFAALCPELMSEKYNGVCIRGESQYTIGIHAGMDVQTGSFAQTFMCGPEPTFVFVCLGDDEDNINCAANLRMLCERRGAKPIIRTIIHSEEESRALEGVCNYRGQPYAILTIGELGTSYSEDTLMESELEQLALRRHLKWGEEEEFWQFEYNYRSSMASAVHMQARVACAIPGADKEESQLTEEERDIIEKLEHRRWNAYMRSEGYVYSGSPEKSSRNDLAKMHHDLVDFEALSEEEKRKDSKVGSL